MRVSRPLVTATLTAIGLPAIAAAALLFDGSEFPINTYTRYDQASPAVAAGDDGSFVVVWHSLGQDDGDPGVFGQRYDSAGEAIGTEFQVNRLVASTQRAGHKIRYRLRAKNGECD